MQCRRNSTHATIYVLSLSAIVPLSMQHIINSVCISVVLHSFVSSFVLTSSQQRHILNLNISKIFMTSCHLYLRWNINSPRNQGGKKSWQRRWQKIHCFHKFSSKNSETGSGFCFSLSLNKWIFAEAVGQTKQVTFRCHCHWVVAMGETLKFGKNILIIYYQKLGRGLETWATVITFWFKCY